MYQQGMSLSLKKIKKKMLLSEHKNAKEKKKQQSIATTVTYPTNQSSSAVLGPHPKKTLPKMHTET